MNLGAFIQALRKAGFDGAMALDLYAYDYEAVAPDALTYLCRLLERGA